MIPRTSGFSISLVALLAITLESTGARASTTAATTAAATTVAAKAAAATRISGTATYRERVAMPPGAKFEATLEAVPKEGAPAVVIARLKKTNPSNVPISFEIPYDASRIDAKVRYVVRAGISVEGRMRFASDASTAVLTHGNSDKVTIVMRAVPGEAAAGSQQPGISITLENLPATFAGVLPCADCPGIRYQLNLLPGGAYMQRTTYLRYMHDDSYYEVGGWSLTSDRRKLVLDGARDGDSYWAMKDAKTLRMLDRDGNPINSGLKYELARRRAPEPMEPRLRLGGMFRSVADAPRFRECGSGLHWPVAMSDDYKELERAWTAHRTAPGAELMVSLNGRIENRPRTEGGGTEPTLVVEKFLRTIPGQLCPEKAAVAGLENCRWCPVRLGDLPIAPAGGEREPWLVLEPRAGTITGSSGCNHITGKYETVGQDLRFGTIASTRMACLSMETETAFLKALGLTRHYRVTGRVLELLDDQGRLLARLEERNLR